MEKQTITIPDGCKAEIRQENGKTVIVIEENQRWRADRNSTYYKVLYNCDYCSFIPFSLKEKDTDCDNTAYINGNYFRTEKGMSTFCDDLNNAIKPLFDKAKRGEYDK